jgi:hypothetical protein
VADWIGDLNGKLVVAYSVRVTGGQGAASAGWAELRTVETWDAAAAPAEAGGSRRIGRMPSDFSDFATAGS